jgi:hypothetical protein
MYRAAICDGMRTDLLVGNGHSVPSLHTLSADSTLSHVWSKVFCNDGTRCLHVQEVRRQRSLGRIGIMSSLLLLCLGLAGRRIGRSSSAQATQSTEEGIIAEAGECRLNIHARPMFAEDGIGVFYVGARESSNGIL